MTGRRALRWIHLASTVWFIACFGYLLVSVLRQVGFDWWVIFSLSGPTALVVFLLVSVYLFTLYRGIGGAPQTETEHPLTASSYYMALYVAAPALGGLAGILGVLGESNPARFVLGVALGTMAMTFAVWVIVDPIAGLLEMLLPESRRYRAERLAHAEAQRWARREKREHLLAEAFAREERERQQWQEKLQTQAQKLAALLACDSKELARAEQEAVDIGAQAWRLGGSTCMRQLHDMTIAACQEPEDDGKPTDYLSYWWDGIGDWRKPSLD